MTINQRTLYELDFTDKQWEELNSLSCGVFDVQQGDALPRPHWLTLANVALGKAQLVEQGHYNMGAGTELETEEEFNERWAQEMRDIAQIILDFFQPGDGKI